MNWRQFFNELDSEGAYLQLVDDDLIYDGPPEWLTTERLQYLQAQKPKIIDFLKTDSITCPLSYGQKALWFEQQLDPSGADYNISVAVRIQSSLVVDALRVAFQGLLNRHEALRTVFPVEDGIPTQRIYRYQPDRLNVIDATAWTEEFLHEQVTAAHEQPFDLETGPLWRIHLWQRSQDDHILSWTIHHLIADGWSSWMALDELQTLYAATLADEPAPLPPVEATYRDFVAWQHEMITEEGEALWEYWQEQLGGELPVLQLPLDRPRPANQSSRGASCPMAFSPALTAQLRELAKAQGVTLYSLLMAAFQTLLHRYSGQNDILVGSPAAGRSRPEYARTFGYFMNPVVIRGNLAENPPFATFLAQTHETVRAALRHQNYPFPLLVERLQPERTPNIASIFQAMFTLQQDQTERVNHAQSAASSGRLTFVPYDVPQFEGKFDLNLELFNNAESLRGRLKYNPDLFDSLTVQRLIDHFRVLLAAIVEDPAGAVDELPLLTPAERHQLLVEWNDTAAEYPQQKSIHQLFEEQVLRTPDEIAITASVPKLSLGKNSGSDSELLSSLTFQELNERANQLANYLISKQVGINTLVGICLDRSVEMVVGLLGILKTGAAYLPLDPNYPLERLNYMLEDSRASVVLSQAAHRHLFAKGQSDRADLGTRRDEAQPNISDIELIQIDADWPQIEQAPTRNLQVEMPADAPAYLIYTSGSTGEPKGVVGLHRGAINRFCWMWRTYPFASDEICCQKTTLSFVDSVWEVFGPLLQGIPTVVIQDDVVRASAQLIETLTDHQVSRIVLVPSLLRAFLDALLDKSESNPVALPSLKYCICSGEVLPAELARRFQAQVPHCKLINLYGSSEVSADVTYFDVSKDTYGEYVPIGRPIANTQIYLLNNAMQPVPVGVRGSLYVGGDGLALGYHNRPALTSERFISYSAAERPETRLYATGDLARYRPDGQIEFLGRNDFQVNVRGFRIELGEIERALADHPSVAEVAVSTWMARTDDTRLVAYVVPTAMVYPDSNNLRGHLQCRLPDYMVPNHFVLLDELPLLPNGKLDVQALPVPEDRSELQTEFVAPQTQLEQMVATIFEDVLGVVKVGRHDNFFALGGHSLLATQVMSRLQRLHQIELPLRALFESSTVEDMATTIESLQAAQNEASQWEIPPLEPQARRGPQPLSFAQERMWFINELAQGTAAYNISVAVRIAGPLDFSRLRRAFDLIVERHEILRTTFDVIDGQPMQVIAESKPIEISRVDLQTLSGDEQQARAQEAVNETAQQIFDLVNGPLLRACLIQLNAEEQILALSMHHIISDQWSNGIIGRELTAIYGALCTETPIRLPQLPIQYADYGQWQRRWLTGEILEAELAFWKETLKDVATLDLPTDYPRPALKTYNGALCKRAISPSTMEAVRSFCRREHVTPYMFFVAIFKTILLRNSGQRDIAIGSPIANRNWFEVEPLLGTFVNTVVLRSQIEENVAFRDLLHAVRETTLDAFQHQDFPFEKLVEELKPPRDLSRSPLFQVFFNVVNAPLSLPELHGTSSTEYVWPESSASQFDLSLIITTDLFPHMMFEYNTDLFKEETIVQMLGHLDTLVQSALSDPDQSVDTIQMLTGAELERFLHRWNDTCAVYPRDKCVHELFEEQANRTPDAVAVLFDERHLSDNWNAEQLQEGTHNQLVGTLSYRELNERANQLAHHLQACGVGPETNVAICCDRSLEMVIGLLGILKAGGVYVPLDPHYPHERLTMMMEDADVTFLLTQKHLHHVLNLDAPQVVLIDKNWPQISAEMTSTPQVTSQPHNRAYVIFTSGSTGRPKGVQIPHQALVNFLWSMKKKPGLKSDDTWLSITTLSFDIAGLELFLPIITGAKLVLTPQSSTVDGALLAQLLEHHNVSVMQATPATWRLLLGSGWQGKPDLKILCGGEALSPVLGKTLLGKCAELWNMYGPTETTVWSTVHQVLPEDEQVFIGRPISNTCIYILDEALNPTPVGVPGVLYIGGDGVALGYLNRPELTTKRFIDNPFGEGKIYNTGDLARYHSDGRIECLGRIDSQVKVRGFRIELGEIEANLAQHDDIRAAAVSTWSPTEDDKRLVAYLVPLPNNEIQDEADSDITRLPDVGELRSYLQKRLPEYMIPSHYVVLDALPLTPNGKVNYKALPEPQRDSAPRSDYVEAQTTVEKQIADIFAKVLGVDKVGRHDDFFALGGHSLLAVQLFAQIEERVANRRLPLALLFQAPTVAEIATLIQTKETERIWPLVVPLQTEGNRPPLFCIHAAGGNVLLYRDLANNLAKFDQPVYGIQSQGLDGQQPILTTVEEMAAVYVEHIQNLQPSGPYLLLGYCLGGTIAYDVAQRLMQQGETVAFVGLLETYNWAMLKEPSLMNLARYQLQRVEFIARNVSLLDGYDRRQFLIGKWERFRSRTSIWQGSASGAFWRRSVTVSPRQPKNGNGNGAYDAVDQRNGMDSSNGAHGSSDTNGRNLTKTNARPNDSVNKRLAQIWKANDLATITYNPSAYPGHVTQFVPLEDYVNYRNPEMGWEKLAHGGAEVQKLPVYPAGMIHNPFAEKLAESVARQIEAGLAKTSF